MNICALAAALSAAATAAYAQSPSTVLVVANGNNANSVALAQYYMTKRSVPARNLLLLSTDPNDNADSCSLAFYKTNIATPVYAKIKTLPQIDYIVLCRNLPIKITDTTNSVDSTLASVTGAYRLNPYCYTNAAFTSAKYGVYLVTRLDGWSWSEAASLVDRAIAARASGTFVFDQDPARSQASSYAAYNRNMTTAATAVSNVGKISQLDTTSTFVLPPVPIGGYVSWGSNDSHYSSTTFQKLQFVPGAIAETAVSTSGSNIRYCGGTQSQAAQLIRDGVTGVKAYVAEPYIGAISLPHYLFPRYLAGYNLAEAFYAASPYMGWKDVVLGDPLCAPYAH